MPRISEVSITKSKPTTNPTGLRRGGKTGQVGDGPSGGSPKSGRVSAASLRVIKENAVRYTDALKRLADR